MGMPVVSVAAGGIAVIEVPNGMPVTEAANGRGLGVTKVVGKPYGLPVTFVNETGGPVTPAFATFDGVSSRVMLSNGNLTATYNGGGTNDSGARSTAVKSAGKYYYEVTPALTRNGDCIGVLLSTGTYSNMDNLGTNCAVVYGSGAIWSNNANTGKSIAAWAGAPGPAIRVAIDLGARLGWFCRAAGNWNGDALANPATGIGGVTIAAGNFGPALGFTGILGDSAAANFGATAFTGAVPSGFTAGWPA